MLNCLFDETQKKNLTRRFIRRTLFQDVVASSLLFIDFYDMAFRTESDLNFLPVFADWLRHNFGFEFVSCRRFKIGARASRSNAPVNNISPWQTGSFKLLGFFSWVFLHLPKNLIMVKATGFKKGQAAFFPCVQRPSVFDRKCLNVREFLLWQISFEPFCSSLNNVKWFYFPLINAFAILHIFRPCFIVKVRRSGDK